MQIHVKCKHESQNVRCLLLASKIVLWLGEGPFQFPNVSFLPAILCRPFGETSAVRPASDLRPFYVREFRLRLQ